MPRYIQFDPTATFSTPGTPVASVHNTTSTAGGTSTLYLPFDSNTNDTSANPVSVTIHGNAAVQTSVKKFGAGALALDGNADYLTMPAGTFPNGEATWTIEGWAYHNNANDHELIGDGNSNRSLIIFRRDSNKLYVAAHDSAGAVEIYPSNNVSSQGAWYHWALVLDSATLSLYTGGNRIGTGSFSGSGVLRSAVNTVYIGRRDGSSFDMNGYQDDIRITVGVALYSGSTYTVPSSALSALAPTSRGPVSFYTTFDSDLNDDAQDTLSGTATGSAAINTSTKQFGAASLYIPSRSGDYVTYNDSSIPISFTGDYTIEAWVYLTDVTSNNNYIWSKRENSSTHANSAWALKWMGGSDNAWEIYQAQGSSQHVTFHADTISTGVWYHIAVVRAGANLLLFKNGLSVSGTNTTGASGALNTPSTSIVLGDLAGGSSNGFAGYIDDFRISDGVARYTKNFVPPSQAVGATLTGTNETNTTTNYTSLYLPFDSDLNDDSTNAGTGTASGAAISNTQAKFGSYSLHLESTNEYVEYPNHSGFDYGTGDFTIEFWMYPTNTSSTSGLSILGTQVAIGGGIVYTPSNGTYGSFIEFYNKLGQLGLGNGISQWVHVAVCRSSGTLNIFSNGNLVNSHSDTNNYASSGNNFRVGYGGWDASTYQNFQGYIDDLKIVKGYAKYVSDFAVPTSAAGASISETVNDLAVLYMPFDDSSMEDQARNHSVTKSGTAQLSTSVKKFGTSSLSLDGNSDYLTIPNNADFQFGVGNFTIEAWVYQSTDAGSDPGDRHAIINRMHNDTNRSFSVDIRDLDSKQKLVFGFTTDGSSSTEFRFDCDVTSSTWHHIAIVRSGSTVYGFLNGVSQSFAAAGALTSIGTSSLFVGTSDLTIGYRGLSSQYFQGYIDDLKIIKGFAKYTSNFTAPTSALGLVVETTPVDTRSYSSVFDLRRQYTEKAAGNWPT